MDKLQICLAFPITAAFENACQKTNPYLFKLFTSGNDYLQWIEDGKQRYLAKPCASTLTFEELLNLELHLISLLKQLAPHFSFSSDTFQLMPFNHATSR